METKALSEMKWKNQSWSVSKIIQIRNKNSLWDTQINLNLEVRKIIELKWFTKRMFIALKKWPQIVWINPNQLKLMETKGLQLILLLPALLIWEIYLTLSGVIYARNIKFTNNMYLVLKNIILLRKLSSINIYPNTG